MIQNHAFTGRRFMKMDIIVILIFVLTIFLSMRKGFIGTVASFFKGIASVVAAYFLSGPLGRFIAGSPVGESTGLRINSYLQDKWQDSEVYQALPDLFRENADSASTGFIAETAVRINQIAWIILSFIIILVAIRIILGIMVKAAKKSRDKEGFTGTLDWFLGLVMGILLGLIAVFVFLALLFPVASLVAPGHAQDIMSWFDGSFFAQDLYDNNLLLLIFSNLFK